MVGMMDECNPPMTHTSPHIAAFEALFGPIPSLDVSLEITLVHHLERMGSSLDQWCVQVGFPVWAQWSLFVVRPKEGNAFPTLLSPDGCWPHVISDAAIDVCLQYGVSLAWFNRVDLAHDGPGADRAGPVHVRWPSVEWSAIAVWAWGSCISGRALRRICGRELGSVFVIGHSRGGKAALLTAALDSTFDGVVAHNSGTGGAASLKVLSDGSEKIDQLAARFPHWFAPKVQLESTQRELVASDAPYHLLRHLAPRGLCILQAHDDFWANPAGGRHMAKILQPYWSQYPELLQYIERAGGHTMTVRDWQQAAQFALNVANRGRMHS